MTSKLSAGANLLLGVTTDQLIRFCL